MSSVKQPAEKQRQGKGKVQACERHDAAHQQADTSGLKNKKDMLKGQGGAQGQLRALGNLRASTRVWQISSRI